MSTKVVKPVQFLFVDLETDGTKAKGGHILEVSCILTDNKLNRIGQPFHSLVFPGVDKGKKAMDIIHSSLETNPFVNDMHTKNGLLFDLGTLALKPEWKDSRLQTVEKRIHDWLNDLWPEGAPVAEIRMAGHSINSLDFPFIREHMPELASNLSHRTLDISSYVRFFTDCCEIPNDEIPFGLKEAGHRATDDNLMALREAKKLREWVIVSKSIMKTSGLDNLIR